MTGYVRIGDSCAQAFCTDKDFACHNGGTCYKVDVRFACKCQYPFYGTNCEHSDDCKTSFKICKNGGTCVSTNGVIYCKCLSKYGGFFCEKENMCATKSDLCKNGGTCIPVSNGEYACKCKSKYSGKQCTDINECKAFTDICKNSGTCINTIGSFRCNCLKENYGRRCEMFYSQD